MTREIHVDKSSEAAANTTTALNALLDAAICLRQRDDGTAKYNAAFAALSSLTGATDFDVATMIVDALKTLDQASAMSPRGSRPSPGALPPVPEKDVESVVVEHRRQCLPLECRHDGAWHQGYESARRDIDATKRAHVELLKMYDDLLDVRRRLGSELSTLTDERDVLQRRVQEKGCTIARYRADADELRADKYALHAAMAEIYEILKAGGWQPDGPSLKDTVDAVRMVVESHRCSAQPSDPTRL